MAVRSAALLVRHGAALLVRQTHKPPDNKKARLGATEYILFGLTFYGIGVFLFWKTILRLA